MQHVTGRMPTVLREPPTRPSTAFDRTTADARYASGFHELEQDDFEHFRWMGLRGRIEFEPRAEPAFAEMRIWSGFHDLRQHLTVETGGRPATFELPTAGGRSRCRCRRGAGR